MEQSFDDFVKENNIKDEELGEAFAAYLSGLGWNGTYEKVED